MPIYADEIWQELERLHKYQASYQQHGHRESPRRVVVAERTETAVTVADELWRDVSGRVGEAIVELPSLSRLEFKETRLALLDAGLPPYVASRLRQLMYFDLTDRPTAESVDNYVIDCHSSRMSAIDSTVGIPRRFRDPIRSHARLVHAAGIAAAFLAVRYLELVDDEDERISIGLGQLVNTCLRAPSRVLS